MTILEETMIKEFVTNDVKTTSVIVDNCAKRVNVHPDPDFAHAIRNTQQTLKKKGVIEHLGYNKWRRIPININT